MTEDTGGDRRLRRRTLLKSTLLASGLAGCFSGDDRSQSTDTPTHPTPEQAPPTATSPPPSTERTSPPTATSPPPPTERTATTATDDPTQTETPPPEDAEAMDRLIFGNEPSETDHDLTSDATEVFEGQNDRIARRFVPFDPDDADPENVFNSLSVTMDCHPSERTYLTIKFSTEWEDYQKLMLMHGADFVGYAAYHGGWPPISFPSRQDHSHSDFHYLTHRLPTYLTEGQDSVDLRIANISIDDTTGTSHGLYRAWTHTDPLAVFADEPAVDFDTGTVPGRRDGDVMAPVIDTIQDKTRKAQQKDTTSAHGTRGLAVAYSRSDWIDTVDQDAILGVVRRTLDGWVRSQAESSPQEVVGRGWEPHGMLGGAFARLSDAFEAEGWLDEPLADHPDGEISRRDAYADFFDTALSWRASDRRQLYNQVLFVTLALVRMNRALVILDPETARDQTTVDRWIDEAIGLTGWTQYNGEPENSYNASGSYHQTTAKAMNKEPQYVSSYGETGLEVTLELAEETGLDRVKAKARDMVRARSNTRWLAKEWSSGNPIATTEGSFSIRNPAHPGPTSTLHSYGKKPFLAVSLLGDEVSKRWAELALEHDRAHLMDPRWFKLGHVANSGRTLPRWIQRVEGYRALQGMDASEYVLPMHRQRHVWTDVDLGLVSLTDGQTRMMALLGCDAAGGSHGDPGVNGLVRAHYHGPEGDRVINADMTRVEYPFEGAVWERENLLNAPLRSSFWDPGAVYMSWEGGEVDVNQALAGKEVPQAAKPNGDPWPSGDPRVGMGVHYREADVGPYRIGINSTGAPERGFGPGEEYEMEVPEGTVIDLSMGDAVTGETVVVPPRTGVVLKRDS